MKTDLQNMKELLSSLEREINKFDAPKRNLAAGTRARKHLQELKNLAQDMRVKIQDVKNDLKG